MAVQRHTAALRLADDGVKLLGVSRLTTTPVTSPGLVEGKDFVVDRPRGTIRRLRQFGSDLLTFACEYDDGSEAVAAAETARANDYDTAKQALVSLQAYVDTSAPTAAQTTAAVKLLCRVAIILIRRAMGIPP